MLHAFYAFQFIKSYVKRKIDGALSGAMMKSVYDTDNDGVVDNSKRLNGNLSSYYAKESEIIFFVNDDGYVCQRVMVEDS
jgi:hypothetical protein